MAEEISLYPKQMNYVVDNDSICLFSENSEWNKVENLEEAEETNQNENYIGNFENNPNLTSDNKEKEFPIVLLGQKSEDKNEIKINKMNFSTKPISGTLLENGSLEKDNNKTNEIILISPDKKRNRTDDEIDNQKNNKGNHKKNFLPKIKTHFFNDLHENLITRLIQKSDFCINNNIKLNKITSEVYLISKASENLELLNTKLSDVYSKYDGENENAINLIIRNISQDSPLNNNFNKTILELINIYVGKSELKNNSYNYFRSSYSRLKIHMQYINQKALDYISKFDYYSKNIEYEYNEMNKKAKPKRGSYN